MDRLLEVIATSPEEAIVAAGAGADRIELIAAMSEGGLTPSYGTIVRTVQAVSIPVRVMVRPHSRSFIYSQDELETMTSDIRMIREAGAAGLVLGVLTPDGQVDTAALERLCEAAPELPVTYHRAIDEARDIAAALRSLELVPSVDRVLTSGGDADGAWHVRRKLQALQSSTDLILVAAKGLSADNLGSFLADAKNINEIHVGTGVRFGGRADEQIDPDRVRACLQLLRTGRAEAPDGEGGAA